MVIKSGVRTMKDVWKFIEHHRFTVIAPLLGILLWGFAVGCTPSTANPANPTQQVNATELGQSYSVWQKQQEIMMMRWEFAAADIEKQKENWGKFTDVIMTLASGSVADWPGLMQLIIGSGLLGMIADRVRVNGVIGGMNKKTK